MTATPAPKGYLPTLDGWRAIAILGVVIAHGTHLIFGEGGALASPFLFQLRAYGVKGVDLFFGISGFLICSRLLEEQDTRGRISLRGFYLRRFMRILPPYAVFLGTLAALGALGMMVLSRHELLYSALFLRNYMPFADTAEWHTGHLWSLAIEEHFYLLWPGLLVLWTPRKATGRVVLFALAIAAWRVIEFRLQLLPRLVPGVGFFTRSDVRLDALMWGCFFALALHDARLAPILDRCLARPLVRIAAGLALIVVIVAPMPFGLVWQSILIPLVLVGTVRNPGAMAGRILETKPLRWVGRISYSLYLWQQVFLLPEHGADQVGNVPHLLLNLAAAFACAIASYHLIERPMIRVGHRLAPPTTEGRA